MTKLSISILKPIVFAAAITFILSSCTMVTNKDQKALSFGTCEGCHTDYEHLKLVHSPDTGAPAGGCGGTVTPIEPFDRVFMDTDKAGYESYKSSTHATLGCTGCHNGTDMTSDKNIAHGGDFLRHPSEDYNDKCGNCHSNEVSGFATNLHNGIGQKDKVTKRSGLSGHAAFADLPQHQIEGYTANCAICHGTCGNCHVVRPPAAAGGLLNNHDFNPEPDMLATCVKCHSSRGGHAYLGLGSGTVPDVHLTEEGYECLDCHTGAEIHGNGEPVDHRYEYSELPTCTQCHHDLVSESNDGKIYHAMHQDDFNCQVCHSQDYNSCGSCHVHAEGARQAAYLDFKIALNPLQNPDANHDFPMALVRRTLGAPDNFDVYTGEDYANFDAFPIFNYTTPHNIIKVTSRTVEGADFSNCMVNCHIRNEGGTFINKEYYLMMDDLVESWQISSTSFMTVDDELPSSWFIDSSK